MSTQLIHDFDDDPEGRCDRLQHATRTERLKYRRGAA